MSASIITFSLSQLDALKAQALAAPTKRARINLHERLSDEVQEMVICECKDTYIRPHRHVGKLESFHIIDGLCTVVYFDDEGGVAQTIPMGGVGSGRAILYRQHTSAWHTLLIETDFVTLHETVQGPFDPATTQWAAWSPAADKVQDAKDYIDWLRNKLGI